MFEILFAGFFQEFLIIYDFQDQLLLSLIVLDFHCLFVTCLAFSVPVDLFVSFQESVMFFAHFLRIHSAQFAL